MEYVWVLVDEKCGTVNVYKDEASLRLALIRRYGSNFKKFKQEHKVPIDFTISEYVESIEDCTISKKKILVIK